MNGHVDWFLAASEEANGLEGKLRMMVGNHLLDVGATVTCLALAYVCEHLLDIDLILAIFEGFASTMTTTKELHELSNSYMPIFAPFFGLSNLIHCHMFLGLMCTK